MTRYLEIGFPKNHLCFIGLRFLPFEEEGGGVASSLLPINYGESLQIIYSISGISSKLYNEEEELLKNVISVA